MARITVLMAFALLIFTAGCTLPWASPKESGPGTTGERPNPASAHPGRMPHEKVPNTITYEPPRHAPKNRAEAERIADRLVEIALADPYVKSATAVVLGPYAVVGINVDGSLDNAQVTTTKFAVAEALKNDPYGARAIVTADPDITARLKEMRDKMAHGEPLTAVLDELADIVSRISPQLPRSSKTRSSSDADRPSIAPGMPQPGANAPGMTTPESHAPAPSYAERQKRRPPA